MIVIPQVYLKEGRVAMPEGTTSPLFKESPLDTASAIKAAGAEAILAMDLGVPTVGVSKNLQEIKNIREGTGLAIYVGGAYRSERGIEAALEAGAELVVLGPIAYQQPAFLESAAKRFPGRIATHIEVRAGRVTIPGYTVVTNKGPLDYAEQFLKAGVRHILYTDNGPAGVISDEGFANLALFCKQVAARMICASELSALSDIERMMKLCLPRLDGIILGRSLHAGRFDLRSAVTLVNDLTLAQSDESTLTEM